MPRRSQVAREIRDANGEPSPSSSRLRPSASARILASGKGKRLQDMELEEVFERQDPKVKAVLGQEYRDMQGKADEMRGDLSSTDFGRLRVGLKKGADLFDYVKDPSLASVDARFIQTTTDTAMGLARKMKIQGNEFDVNDFLIRIKSLLGLHREELEDQDASSEEEDELDESLSQPAARGARKRRRPARKGHLGDWEKIGWTAAKLNRRVHGLEVMYGPLKVEVRQRIQRQRKKQVVEPETRPEEIQTQAGGKAPKDETVANVRKVGSILRRVDTDGQGINFFRLALNPDDFGQTVENCFYLSFLIREGKAGVDIRPDGEVMVYAKEEADEDAGESQKLKNQAVMELDLETWEEAKSLFNITEPIIPHRENTVPGPLAPNAWYS